MSEYYLRKLEAIELNHFYKIIERDFASGEYPPLDVLSNQLQKGRQEGFVLCDGTNDFAYCFCAASPDHDYVLISLFAVFKEYRGQGIGSTFLEKLHTRYAHKQALIVEVERPENAHTAEERDKRLRRIAFYEKAGYRLIKGINYIIWDIPMHLMVLSINAFPESIDKGIKQIMQQIYCSAAGERFLNKIQFK
jgi:GNAT superfamily N-acetyltransferase